MFEVERVFSSNDHQAGMVKWYFSAREGDVGPFYSKSDAEKALLRFKKACEKSGLTGGRSDNSLDKPDDYMPSIKQYILKEYWL